MDQPIPGAVFARAPTPRSRLILIILMIATAGLVGATIFENSVIYGGLVKTALLPSNLLFTDQVGAMGLAPVLSVAILTFYLGFSLITLSFKWAGIVTTGILLIAISAVLSFISV